jgi:hypothetical protein
VRHSPGLDVVAGCEHKLNSSRTTPVARRVWLTTGVQLRGPEGAQRLRATSAATSELCGSGATSVRRLDPWCNRSAPFTLLVPIRGLQWSDLKQKPPPTEQR